jgi:hypothetical protein
MTIAACRKVDLTVTRQTDHTLIHAMQSMTLPDFSDLGHHGSILANNHGAEKHTTASNAFSELRETFNLKDMHAATATGAAASRLATEWTGV